MDKVKSLGSKVSYRVAIYWSIVIINKRILIFMVSVSIEQRYVMF